MSSLQADYASSPARRSTGDLQKILDSMMGGRQSVLVKELPSLLRAYEIKHGITILDPPDYDNVAKQAEMHPELALDPENLFQFLSICTQAGRAAPPSPTPKQQLPHSASLPPSAFRQMQDKTPRAGSKTHNRRLSDRIRSPSDSSGSSEDEDRHQSTFRPRNGRQQSAPPLPFNASSLTDRALPPLPTHRSMNFADAGKPESPLAQRIRAAGKGKPPSSFAFNGATSFARPSPASRRRRGSTSGQSASGAEDPKSPDFPAFGRSISSGSVAIMSSPVMSPTSPRSSAGVDNTSYHAGARSSDGRSEAGDEEDEMRMEGGSQHGGDAVTDEVDELGEIQEMDDPRLSRISTESSASLRTSHDKLRALQKQNTELARKLKDSERQLAVLGAENERLFEDLQDKLEEARSEITQRRKEEKDMKGKERTLLIQISGFEADISSLQRSLENAKQNHASMQKMYNSQCDEAQRLRDLLRDRDNTISEFETEVSAHEADEEKYTGEISAREADIKRLEAELLTARRAESHLETHKQENLQLRETIDRMRFDLDEARAAATKSTGHSKGPTSSSGPATLSRNLGDELHRRLLDAERIQEEAGDEQEEEDEYVETVVTTQRTRKVANKAAVSKDAGGSTTPKATCRIEEEIREYVDVGTATDPPVVEETPDEGPIAGPSSKGILAPDEPPAYTRVPDALIDAEVLLKAHPHDHEMGDDVDEEYEAMVDSLGMRCMVFEAEMKKRGIGRSRGDTVAGTPIATPPGSMSRRRTSSRSPIPNIGDQNDRFKVALWVGAALLLGVSVGAHLYSPPTGISARDYQLYNAMNSLAMGAGVGEGFLPASGKRVWEVTRMAAGRVPS